jgi:tRNA(Ile)-lysidine synthase TilS/MesJ
MNRPNRPDGLVSRTREAFLRNRIPLDAPTVLGVSGGVDSMSLLHALWELRVPVEARHVNYGLRGADSDADEAAVRATAQIKKREAELVDEFRKKGLAITQVDRKSFVDAVLKNKPLESMGFTRSDYDRIQAAK